MTATETRIGLRRDPYAPPLSPSNMPPGAGDPTGVPVGPATRLLHLLVDSTVSYLVLVIVVLVDFFLGLGALRLFSGGISPFVIAITVLVVYYFVTEAIFGRTVGKLITGTRVLDAAGNRAGVWRIALRTLARLIPFEALSFLVPGARGWHDALSDTYVVRFRDRSVT